MLYKKYKDKSTVRAGVAQPGPPRATPLFHSVLHFNPGHLLANPGHPPGHPRGHSEGAGKGDSWVK
jgi:hypothetical protein